MPKQLLLNRSIVHRQLKKTAIVLTAVWIRDMALQKIIQQMF